MATASGNVVAAWTLQSDGHYRKTLTGPGGGPDETGKVQFQHGVWAMQRDPGGGGSGAYTIYDHAILSVLSSGGAVIWFRGSDSPAPVQPSNGNSGNAVEPDLVGTWRLLKDTPNGPVIATRSITADGHYQTTYQGIGHGPRETGQLHCARRFLSLRYMCRTASLARIR